MYKLSSKEASIKITASTIVDFDKKSDVLLAPNIVDTPEPPTKPDSPPPFDACINTTIIKRIQTITNIIIENVIIDGKNTFEI